jgi:hypothetical protein
MNKKGKVNYRHADNTDSKGFSQTRKKICGHLFKSASSERLLSESGFTGL